MALVGGDFGDIQIVDPATGSLRLITQAGFGPEFLDYFAVVEDVHSTCRRAARQGAQTAVADVRADPRFTPHREIAAAARFRAAQSTPLVDYAGHLIGMVSTHFQRPHRPSDRDVRVMELYADFAGEALTRHLGQVSGGDPPDPVGWAMGLGPARSRPRPGSRRVGPVRVVGHRPDDRELRPPGRPTWAERSTRLTGLRSRP
jgi:hypothetical protein